MGEGDGGVSGVDGLDGWGWEGRRRGGLERGGRDGRDQSEDGGSTTCGRLCEFSIWGCVVVSFSHFQGVCLHVE